MKKLGNHALKFNPKDYEYLDRGKLQNFIEAFVNRNKKFRSKMNSYYGKTRNNSENEWSCFAEDIFNIFKVRPRLPLHTGIIRPPYPVEIPTAISFRRVFKNEEEFEEYVKHWEELLWLGKHPSSDDKDVLRFELRLRSSIGINHNNKYDLSSILNDISRDTRNLLLVGINLDRGQEEIVGDIKKLFKLEYFKPANIKRRFKKWKYYLVAYDLKDNNSKMTFRAIADQFDMVYRDQTDEDSCFSERTCEEYYGEGKKLVDGGYKKYI